jgi:N-acylneuraminate cytidylyltransferase
MKKKAYCIVPARGGSKRIVGKNSRPFHGVPIILRVLGILGASKLFDEIIVSSDDLKITQLVEEAGYIAPFVRPGHLATDTIGTSEVANHAIEWLLGSGAGKDADFLLAYPTAVMMTEVHLREARQLLNPGVCDFVFSAARFPSEVQRGWWKAEDSSVKPVMPGNQSARSQDFEPVYYDAGQFYWTTYNGWRPEVLEQGVKRRLYEIDQIEAVDINTEDDWIRAERLFKFLRE